MASIIKNAAMAKAEFRTAILAGRRLGESGGAAEREKSMAPMSSDTGAR
jgi:hypothetical protein